jgi:hypothetical protein
LSAEEGASDLKRDKASLKCSSLSERIYNFVGWACFNKAREIPRPTLLSDMTLFMDNEPLSSAGDEEDFVRGFGDQIQIPGFGRCRRFDF